VWRSVCLLWVFGGTVLEEGTCMGFQLFVWLRMDVLWRAQLLFLFRLGHGFDVYCNSLHYFASRVFGIRCLNDCVFSLPPDS